MLPKNQGCKTYAVKKASNFPTFSNSKLINPVNAFTAFIFPFSLILAGPNSEVYRNDSNLDSERIRVLKLMIFVPAPNHRITSLLDSVGYTETVEKALKDP